MCHAFSSMGPLQRIDPTTHRTMSKRSTMELHLAPVIRTVVIAMSALDKRTYSGRVEKCAMLLAHV